MMNTTVSFEAKGYEDIPALLTFMQRNLQCGELSIEMTADDFYAQTTITSLENGAHFMTMNACGYRIEHHIACDLQNRRLYLIYSDHKMQWGEEGLSCTLPYRDSFLIDSTKSFRIASPGYQKTRSFGIPFSLLGDRLEQVINGLTGRKLSTIKYGDEINKILSTTYHAPGLAERLDIVTNLIKVITYNETPDSNGKYDRIVKKITMNIYDESLTLPKLAQLCAMSARTIQYILASHGTSFNRLSADIRLKLLCENIHKMKNKRINEIVFLSGYNSFSTAARHFKRKFNQSITDYISAEGQ
ncbi:helix-turn-helix domain-containing protein [Edwardsiella piscicida]|uniref:AraC family transcriptional regulator n=3 Tax=Edwardsiella TaxID=635 RepID=A0AAQ3H498_EDWPI|nr:AraC family transcriptional regulator [Edwardsiella piscicida]ACY85673.1 hypothetical protein ETAE_2840 [Edwardsiella tarda EIB202]ADM42679.1 putative DNA-binding Protein [Edwardsiella tarda FL6-60]BAU80582.1 hypothetical protein SAMD00131843_00233 [Edwardsiella tarda]AOP44070.1 AraC family transcriptional regulator [Edwardsiella piscicida]ARD18923.1 AraC family transcriptional regulator [Edwardsiella piscicida]